jgi:hypothetical protein
MLGRFSKNSQQSTPGDLGTGFRAGIEDREDGAEVPRCPLQFHLATVPMRLGNSRFFYFICYGSHLRSQQFF